MEPLRLDFGRFDIFTRCRFRRRPAPAAVVEHSRRAMNRRFLAACVVGVLSVGALAEPRVRPAEWAQPVVGTALHNLFQVSPDLFRSEQPGAKEVQDLKSLGIRTIISLRKYRDDAPLGVLGGFRVVQVSMDAASVKGEEVLQTLRVIRDAPKPVLVHCWHGSDRTGVVVAAYRIVFQQWSNERAIDELKNGGFGYHAKTYGNLVSLLRTIDGRAWRNQLGVP
jgi:tyrosine-protein phosphatase SIW14